MAPYIRMGDSTWGHNLFLKQRSSHFLGTHGPYVRSIHFMSCITHKIIRQHTGHKDFLIEAKLKPSISFEYYHKYDAAVSPFHRSSAYSQHAVCKCNTQFPLNKISLRRLQSLLQPIHPWHTQTLSFTMPPDPCNRAS